MEDDLLTFTRDELQEYKQSLQQRQVNDPSFQGGGAAMS